MKAAEHLRDSIAHRGIHGLMNFLERLKSQELKAFQVAMDQLELDLELTGRAPRGLECVSSRKISTSRPSKADALSRTRSHPAKDAPEHPANSVRAASAQ